MITTLLKYRRLFSTVVPISSMSVSDLAIRNTIKERRFLRFGTYKNYRDRKISLEFFRKLALQREAKQKNRLLGSIKRVRKLFPHLACQCGGVFRKQKTKYIFLKNETFKDWERDCYRQDTYFRCCCGNEKVMSNSYTKSYSWHGAWSGHYNG